MITLGQKGYNRKMSRLRSLQSFYESLKPEQWKVFDRGCIKVGIILAHTRIEAEDKAKELGYTNFIIRKG
jgi:hypothetical protein